METVRRPEDLITTAAQIEDGFAKQAEIKMGLSVDRIEAGRVAVDKLRSGSWGSVDELLADSDVRSFVLGAAMLSVKSQGHLPQSIQLTIASKVVSIEALNDPDRREALLSDMEARYLLTAGDSLGGSLRNRVGWFASEAFGETLGAEIAERGHAPAWKRTHAGKLSSLTWAERDKGYAIAFDKKVPFVGGGSNNVDFSLLETDDYRGSDLSDKWRFLGLGELKGGIDPAGADEHWKTAGSTLDRIRISFGDDPRRYFFVGAVITQSMAVELMEMLRSGRLTGAANLNVDEQVREVAQLLLGPI